MSQLQKSEIVIPAKAGIVVATTIEFTATIVTGDPEFKETESRAAVLWL